jgi:hypothetical protein
LWICFNSVVLLDFPSFYGISGGLWTCFNSVLHCWNRFTIHQKYHRKMEKQAKLHCWNRFTIHQK